MSLELPIVKEVNPSAVSRMRGGSVVTQALGTQTRSIKKLRVRGR